MTDATDRLIDALASHDQLERDVRLGNAIDRSVRRFHRQKAGLEPWSAMDALKAAQEACEQRRSDKAPKAA